MIGTISARSALRLGLGMGASVLAMTTAGQALAQTPCTNVTPEGICEIENSGSSGALTIASRVQLINSGSITGAPAVMGSVPVPSVGTPTLVTLIIENRDGATITGTGGTAMSSPGALINAGTINGNVTGLTQYVADGGVLNGNLVLGSGAPTDFNPQIFVQRGDDAGVTGTISAGQGIDYYAQSYAESTTLPIALGGGLPTTFEVEGIEARGVTTTVSLASLPGDTIRGLGLLGDGNIVSAATIGVSNTVGAGFPPGFPLFTTAISYLGSPETTSYATIRFQTSAPGAPPQFTVYQVGIGAALNSFTNDGTVNGDVRMTTAEFVNSGTINLVTRATGTLIFTAEDRDFSFSNTGTISYIDNGARAGMAAIEAQYLGDEDAAYAVRLNTFEASEGRNVTIANSGILRGGLSGFLVGETVSFENSGEMSGITSANALAYSVNLQTGRLRSLDGEETDFGGQAVSVVNTAMGIIADGIRINAIADSLVFRNDGVIVGRSDDGRAVSIDQEGIDEGDVANFAFVNSGDLAGDVVLNTSALAATFENSGTIVMDERADFNPDSGSWEAVEFEVSTQGAQTINLANTGTIEQSNRGAVGLSIELEGGSSSTIAIVNSGTIRSDAGGSVVDGTLVGFEAGSQAVNVSTGLAVSTGDVAGQAAVTIDNRAGGLISATGAYATASEDGAMPSPDGSTAYSTALLAAADAVTITNAGTISGGSGATLPDGHVLTREVDLSDNYLAGAIQTGASVDRVTNSETGVITGSIDLGAGDDSFANYGTITGDIFLRNGNDSYIHLLAASFTGTADGGAGEDSLAIDLTGSDGVISNALYDQFINFELFSLISNGTGLVVEEGGTLDLGEDSRIDTPGETAIQGGGEGETVSNSGTINGDVDLGDGDNTFANNGTITGDVTTGEGGDTFNNSGMITGEIDLGDGDDSFSNEGDIIGDVALGGGADSYELGQGSVSGVVDGGSGDDIDSIVVNFSQAQSQGRQSGHVVIGTSVTVTPDTLGNVQGFEQLAVNGPGTVTASGDLPVGVIALQAAALNVLAGTALGTTGPNTVIGSSGAETIDNAGTIKGGVSLGDGADEIANSGSIVGPVDLGQGDDRLTLGSGASFSGAVSGGAGTDVLGLATTGTATAPYEFNAAGFTGFEQLANLSGTAAISGALAIGQIDVTGGRLIGRAGSMLTGNVAVANGATFGSAGTVNGNVTVASGGTLSPGASPGVMTVNGNVLLASGTTTIFEFQPSPLQSDQLLISGTLNIASGTTLSLTGDRPLTPGVAYDLIIATGGITGTFTTVDQAETVLGFLRYSADRLQLLGTFQAGAGASPQATASIDYVNAVLVAGASAELLAAVPSLLASDGTANAAAFALVGPEAYASAFELGIERGLGLAKAGRAGLGVTNRVEPGLFAFAQGQGDWRELDGDAALGISGAKIESYGMLGGVGYGSERGSIGAFVGTIDSEQRIPGLAARTDADGVVAGVIGRFTAGGFDLSAMAAYDWGNADTVRAVPAGGSVSGSYRLRSLVLDASAGYASPISADWALRPEIGITHIATERGAAAETGSPAFNLAVQKGDRNATFADGSLKLLGGRTAEAMFRPWIAAGIRHQLGGERTSATAAFAGNALGFTLSGVSRAETVAIAGAGASIDFGSNVSLYGAYQGEFGEGSDHDLNLGIRIGF